MSETYTSGDIEVLTGLDPVRKRPGMYTDTTSPRHLAQEVIDNGIDEALAGHASKIDVQLLKDGSIIVIDDGRGMPVDPHPEFKVSGVEVILTTLHSGGKFSNKSYSFSGGLHGVGVSVVNALSESFEVEIRRGGKVHKMQFAEGEKATELEVVDSCGQRNTGTKIHFKPDAKYFDTAVFPVAELRHLLRAKAILCSGLKVTFDNQIKGEKDEWVYEDGLKAYLEERTDGLPRLPEEEPFMGSSSGETESVDWALQWLPEGGESIVESYVNLIPTSGGGTHINGLRTGLLDAVREYCEFRAMIPKGLKISAEDVWQQCNYVLSFKMLDPQFSGQTKERLSSREASVFVSGIVKDSFSLWMNQHTDAADQLAELVLANAQRRTRAAKKVVRKKVTSGPALPGKLADCTSDDPARTELFLVEGDSAGGSAKQAREREFQAVLPLRGKILNTWEVASDEVMASAEVHNISVALGLEPGSDDLSQLRYSKICILADADSDGLHIATLLCALFVRHFRSLVSAGHVFVAMPPLYRIDVGNDVYYALDDHEKAGVLERIAAEKKKGKINVQRFKGLGEMNPLQLRETTMTPDTRRLVQLSIKEGDADKMLDMLLAKKRAADRKSWLEKKGNLASV
jgi:topoisomerase-4 subunit B